MKYDDDELLKLVRDERKRSIGFGEGDTDLQEAREKALRFYRGDVTKDIPSIPNRSSAVSTDVAEAVETVLPDIIEIFTGGDDVATFAPVGPEDEPGAQQETDYVNHVVFDENDGFLTFYSAFKDALLTRLGLFTWWWEDGEEVKEETFEGKTEEEVAVAVEVCEQQGAECEYTPRDDGLFDVVIRRTRNLGRVCIKAVPSEDFTVAPDTVNLKDTTYCAMRDRPRVQDLIARGVDPETARNLPSYGVKDDAIAEARDEAGEETLDRNEATGDLRQVEVIAHYIRLLDDEDQLCIYKVETDGEETTILGEAEKVESIPFGAITPYINAHRFYGESLADKLIEIQKIKTTLLRMFLDSGYFDLNQRMEVAMTMANEFTISDLLRNEPNMPVRVQQPGALRPLRAGGLSFDAMQALEYVSVMGEQRTGVVRNAQGLKPDTLHDTAKGALALMTNAQKRVRLIARIFAETGVKELFLGVHRLTRKHATSGSKARLRGKWVDVDPTTWGDRKDMTIQIGLGSAGKEQDMMVMEKVLEFQREIIQLQGGIQGPLVTADNVHNALKRFTIAASQKAPELFFSDPQDPNTPKLEPKPDPEMQKAQAEMQIKQAEGQAKLQLQAQEGQVRLALDEQRAQREHDLAMRRQDAEMALKERQLVMEMDLKERLALAEMQLKRELGHMQAEVSRETGLAKVQASADIGDVKAGGEPG